MLQFTSFKEDSTDFKVVEYVFFEVELCLLSLFIVKYKFKLNINKAIYLINKKNMFDSETLIVVLY